MLIFTFFGYEICEMRNKIPYKISNNNAQVTVHLLIIVISWFAGLSAWSSKKVMNLTERGESFLTMGWNILWIVLSYGCLSLGLKVRVNLKSNFLETPLPKKQTKYYTKFCPMKLGQNDEWMKFSTKFCPSFIFRSFFWRFGGNRVSRKKMFLRFIDL